MTIKGITVLGAAALLLVGVQGAAAATLGFAPVDRTNNDITGSPLLVVMPAQQFATAESVTGWSIFVDTNNPGNPNPVGDDVALLVLKDIGASSFEIVAADFRVPEAGLNSYTTSIDVEQGWFIGLFSNVTRVAFDFGAEPASLIGGLPDWDQASEAVGQTLAYGGVGGRVYSLEVTTGPRSPGSGGGVAPIPLPAAGWLLLGGFGALGAVARRRD